MVSRRTVLLSPFLAQDSLKMFADATAYERFMGRWSRLVAPLFVDFSELKDGVKVLDVGSGTGSLAFAVTAKHPQARVIGMDPSQEYIGYARAQNQFGDRAQFEIGDAQSLKFPAASFDAALSLFVFNFIPDRAKALAQVRGVVKPGGKVAAAVWDYGDGMRMLRIFWDAAVQLDPSAAKLDERNMPLCRPGELQQFWKQGGLQNVRETALNITTRFANFADFWDPFLLGQGPAGAYVKKLSAERLSALKAAVKSRLSIASEDKPFSLPARAWAVRGDA